MDENSKMPDIDNDKTDTPCHNLICLNTIWGLGLIDQPLYEAMKEQVPEKPDFAIEGSQPAIGGPAALLSWMIARELYTREQFESAARRYIPETVGKEQKETRDLQRMLILETVDSGFCEQVFQESMSAVKVNQWIRRLKILSPFIIAVPMLIFFFVVLPAIVRFLRFF